MIQKVFEDFFDEVEIDNVSDDNEQLIKENQYEYKIELYYANINLDTWGETSTSAKVVNRYNAIKQQLSYMFDYIDCIEDITDFEYDGSGGFRRLYAYVNINRRKSKSFGKLLFKIFKTVMSGALYCNNIRIYDVNDEVHWKVQISSTDYAMCIYNEKHAKEMADKLCLLFDEDTRPFYHMLSYNKFIKRGYFDFFFRRDYVHTSNTDSSVIEEWLDDFYVFIHSPHGYTEGINDVDNEEYVELALNNPYDLYVSDKTVMVVPKQTIYKNGYEWFVVLNWDYSTEMGVYNFFSIIKTLCHNDKEFMKKAISLNREIVRHEDLTEEDVLEMLDD